jgi:thymidine kinase
MSSFTYTGSITTIVGPMCGGKTTRLISEKRKNEIAGRRVLLLKHPSDDRYSDQAEVTTHDQVSEPGVKAMNANQLFKCGLSPKFIQKHYDVVCIDEGQFYEDVDEFCELLANLGLRVYCSALLGNYRREPFLNISRLMALSEKIIHSRAVDRKSGKEAAFTLKRRSGSDQDIEIGGLELYDAVDRNSYFINEDKKDFWDDEKPHFSSLGIVSCDPPRLTGDGVYTVNAICYPGFENDVTDYLTDSLLGNKNFEHPCWIKVNPINKTKGR